jgi:hypothetical protein
LNSPINESLALIRSLAPGESLKDGICPNCAMVYFLFTNMDGFSPIQAIESGVFTNGLGNLSHMCVCCAMFGLDALRGRLSKRRLACLNMALIAQCWFKLRSQRSMAFTVLESHSHQWWQAICWYKTNGTQSHRIRFLRSFSHIRLGTS